MLGGFVFLSHQVGSFLGVWLGGFLYDRTGSYDIVWYIAIALGVFAALVNLPVRESAIARAGRRSRPEATRHAPDTRHRLVHAGWLGAAALVLLRRVRALHAPGVPGDAGRPDLGLLLSHSHAAAPSPWIVRWSHLLAARRRRARRGLRRGPAHALVRRARASGDGRGPLAGGDRCRGRRFGQTRAGRHRVRALALRRPGASTRWSSPTTSGGRACPTSSRRSRRAACCSTKPSPRATRPSASPRAPTSCCSPANCCGACAGLRVVAYEDGFLAAAGALRAAHRGRPAADPAEPPRHRL